MDVCGCHLHDIAHVTDNAMPVASSEPTGPARGHENVGRLHVRMDEHHRVDVLDSGQDVSQARSCLACRGTTIPQHLPQVHAPVQVHKVKGPVDGEDVHEPHDVRVTKSGRNHRFLQQCLTSPVK
jgi:hypothetical protein